MTRPLARAELSPDLLERLRARFAVYPLIQGWQVAIESVEPGRARMTLGPSPLVLNLMGTVNGGVQATLADMVCAVALCTAFDGAMPFATSDLHIRYLEPAIGAVVADACVSVACVANAPVTLPISITSLPHRYRIPYRQRARETIGLSRIGHAAKAVAALR